MAVCAQGLRNVESLEHVDLGRRGKKKVSFVYLLAKVLGRKRRESCLRCFSWVRHYERGWTSDPAVVCVGVTFKGTRTRQELEGCSKKHMYILASDREADEETRFCGLLQNVMKKHIAMYSRNEVPHML